MAKIGPAYGTYFKHEMNITFINIIYKLGTKSSKVSTNVVGKYKAIYILNRSQIILIWTKKCFKKIMDIYDDRGLTKRRPINKTGKKGFL